MKVSHQVSTLTNRSALRGKLAGRLLGWALAVGTLPAVAQHVPRRGQPMPVDTIRQVVDLPVATIDSLAAEPLTEPVVDSARLAWLQTPATLQELVGDRMSCFETAAPHQFNAAVMAYVRLFTERQRGYTQRVLERQDFYFPIFEKYLTQYHLPVELKYLSVVESALIPTAKSQVGAVGLWQFMPPTAGDLRLKRDEWVDERMHPEKATEAACKHLRYLYGIFHDWELVLAAYNWGAGNVQRVIRKTGKHNFWELYPYMPAETRNYVPTFTAVMYAMTYAKEHDLHNVALHYQHYEPLDTLSLHGQALDMRRLSRALGYPDSLALLRYNPELRRPSLPAGYRPYVLRFPAAAREHLGDVDYATLLAYCQPAAELPQPLAMVMPRLAGVEPWPMRGQSAANGDARTDNNNSTPRPRRISYTLRRGQTLATVADKYDVSPMQLRKWNNLRKNQPLKPGKQLIVFIPQPAAPLVSSTTTLAAPTPPAMVAVLRRTTPTDTAWQALASANTRYARQAQERATRELAQAQALARTQKQLAARAAAARRLSIAQAAAAARATAAVRLGLPAEPADSVEVTSSEELSVAPIAPVTRGVARRRQLLASDLATRPTAEVESTPVALADQPKPTPELTDRNSARRLTHLAKEAQPSVATKMYTVRPGDNLTKLAQEKGISITQLKTWNKLRAETVIVGQRLYLDGPFEAAELPVATQTPATHRAKPAITHPKLETHTVQRGDTLFNIALRFEVSVEELRRLNHLPANAVVKVGQKLLLHG
ncbi:MAG: LysM peptidoglycan-binding domain-containing protein [Janthinobacterium lividum]